MSKSQKYFDPETLARIRPLGLRARTLVEGLVAGLHRSPLRGQSIEFAQHREYAAGDDVRQVDWKVYARSDRYYLKQYEDETSLTCYLLLDQSESMHYGGEEKRLCKLEYAQLIACSLAYLVLVQQDCVGLVTCSSGIDDWLPPSGSMNQLDDMIRVMEQGHSDKRTSLGAVVSGVVQRLHQRSLVIILSDFFDAMDQLLQSLKLVRHAGHDMMLIQILDRDETTMPFDQMTRFEGLEEMGDVLTDPMLIAGAYRKAMRLFQSQLNDACQQLRADYFCLLTDESLAAALPRILASRKATRS